ncbi:MAG TPA: peptidoglycan DD-metalloendopeptidase family protein [Chitinophagaceae bacterium]|nr:peptidoglycan DD-metalloendopeptidase family protein [Chitinophagaceae bacterium]
MNKGKNLIKLAAFWLGVIPFFNVQGQPSGASLGAELTYPQGYFRNPLGIPMELTANFGELRPGHWHMGLDLRTGQKENLPVYAAAAGYIAHIGIRPLSFGKFIVINHPNGYSTLYAHLNAFYPKLENYVRQKQKEKESWAIELDFSENDFKVNKGDLIAKSGNTGGSQGPHLHFEIRDTKTQRCLNTLLFGLSVRDDVSPTISRLAIYNRNVSTYLQTPQMITVVRTDTGYFTKPQRIVTGYNKLSFAITATDRVSGSRGANGIYGANLYYDHAPQIGFIIDSITYAESDYINAHIDKRLRNNGGAFVQHLSKLPGFRGHVYKEIDGNGIIELNDTLVHDIRIEVSDANENISTLTFQVQYRETSTVNQKVPVFGKLLIPDQVNIIDEKEFQVYMPEEVLYDSIPFSYSQQEIFPEGAVSAQHQFGNPVYPLHSDFSVRLKATKPAIDNSKNKLAIVKEWKGAKAVRRGKFENGWISASFDNLGNFQAFIDTTPPTVNAPGKGKDTLNLSASSRIVFTPSDNFGVRAFRAELDGEWLMFSNDKGRSHVYTFDEQWPYGVHELKVTVEDIVGNTTEKTWWVKRYPYTPPRKKVYYKKKKPLSTKRVPGSKTTPKKK